MTDYLCKFTLEKLCAKDIIKEEDMEIYRYGLQLLIATILKGFGIVIVGVLTGLLKEFIIFILCFSGLRIQAGGYHARTVMNCFIGTLVLLFLSIMMVKILPIVYQPYYILISMVASIFFVFLYAPLESKNKPLNKEEIIYRRRSLQTVIIGNIIILISMAFSDIFVYYAAIASTGFLLESLTLIHVPEDEK